MGKEYWVGFDLGGTKMMAVVYDKNFKAVGRERKKTKGDNGDGTERLVGCLEERLFVALASDLLFTPAGQAAIGESLAAQGQETERKFRRSPV